LRNPYPREWPSAQETQLRGCMAAEPEWRGLLRIKELELGGPIEWTAPQSGPG